MKNANIIGASVVFVFSLLSVIAAKGMSIFESGIPGPGFVPLAFGLLMLILSIVLLVQSVMTPSANAHVSFVKRGSGLRDICMISASLIVYAGCIHLFGYSMATLLFLFALLKLVGNYGYRFSLMVSFIATIVLYGIFQYGLGMIFPEPYLFPFS